MNELTNNLRKTYASLSSVKGRREHGLFMAQGTKCVGDTIESFDCVALLATDAWLSEHPEFSDNQALVVVKPADLQKISTLTTPQGLIAIYHIPTWTAPTTDGTLTLALDGVQDPGNLGTIIRVADWMGVRDIVASIDTVDVWNPKVVQATMGAISRVKVHYTDLPEWLKSQRDVPVYGTFLDGQDIYTSPLSQEGIIVMGNEGNGIRPETAKLINRRLFIPPYPTDAVTSESLNVSIATAITLAEFRRRAEH